MNREIKFDSIKRARFSFLHPVYKRILFFIKPREGKYFLFEKVLTFKAFRIFTTHTWGGKFYEGRKHYNIIFGGKYSLTITLTPSLLKQGE